tara:strand:+ start:681 stop:908 length:228 start_codon:yes stop_codon:yes gene_type:complete
MIENTDKQYILGKVQEAIYDACEDLGYTRLEAIQVVTMQVCEGIAHTELFDSIMQGLESYTYKVHFNGQPKPRTV